MSAPVCEDCGKTISYYAQHCHKHTYAHRNFAKVLPREPLIDRFWAKVKKTNGCWLWTASTNNNGFGRVGRGGSIKITKDLVAPRVAYELITGDRADKYSFKNICGNRRCVKPTHYKIEPLGKWSDHGRYYVKQVRINGKLVHIFQHREVWEKANGPIPKGWMVDHINHDSHDNRLENLRAVPPYINNHNRKGPNKNNKSGHLGIYWHNQRQKWHPSIMVQGKKKSLGLYDNIEDAIKVYQEAKEAVYV